MTVSLDYSSLSAGIKNRLYKFYVNTIFLKERNAENELNFI